MKFVFLALILTSISISSNDAYAQCSGRVDPKDVILYIDTHGTYHEILAAQRAACARGETLVVVPSITQSKKLSALLEQSEYISTQYDRVCPGNRDSAACIAVSTQYDENEKALSAFYQEQPRTNKSTIEAALKAMQAKNQKVTSLVVSGHDGGGSVHGDLGDTSKDELIALSKKYPTVTDQMQSVSLWGCFTATEAEVRAWKAGLPQLDIIAGYQGVAPSSFRKASHDYLQDLLVKQESLIASKNDQALLRTINGLNGLPMTNAALYVKPSCDPSGYHYTRNNERISFSEIETQPNCVEAQKQRKTYEDLIARYTSGKQEPPDYTGRSELREIYTFARQNAHCLKGAPALEGDHVGLMLFFNGVRKNFAHVFKSQLNKGQAQGTQLKTADINSLVDAKLKTIPPPEWYDIFTDDVNKGKRIALGAERTDLNRKLALMQSSLAEYPLTTVGKMTRKQIIAQLAAISPVVNHPLLTSVPELGKKLSDLKSIYQKMERYLYQVDSRCMDFLDWHEYDPANPPVPKC